MKTTLFLMSQKGYETLKAIKDNGLLGTVDFVVGSRDRNVEKDYYQEIKTLCDNYNIPHYDRGDHFVITTPFTIAISWRWLIHLEDSTLIVLHDSLLPKYRGFAPLVNMLINKERKIGVTAIFASESYDTGAIICQSSTDIKYPITIAEAIDKVAKNYEECIIYILRQIKSGKELTPEAQNEKEATYSLWRDEADYEIDWNSTAAEILNFINAVSFPFSGASSLINGKKVRITNAAVVHDVKIENRTPGKVIFVQEGQPVVVCGQGLLKIIALAEDETGKNLLPLKNFRTRFS